MKKRIIHCIFILCLVAALPLTALAASTRATVVFPRLTFSGETATCYALVSDPEASDIDVTMKLWQGNSCKKTWVCSGVSYVELNKKWDVETNVTYTLTVDATIDGVPHDRVSVTRTCP